MKGDVFADSALKLEVKHTKFLGYKVNSSKAKVLKIFLDQAGAVTSAKKITAGMSAQIILDQSPFYAESGGQAGDSGWIKKGKNTFVVSDTIKKGKVIIHQGRVETGSFKSGDLVTTEVDLQRRLAIARNHTATHLLQSALRKVLGGYVEVTEDTVFYGMLGFHRAVKPNRKA